MPETLDKVIFSYDDIDLDYINLDIIIFFSHNRDMNIVYLNNINLMITVIMITMILKL